MLGPEPDLSSGSGSAWQGDLVMDTGRKLLVESTLEGREGAV